MLPRHTRLSRLLVSVLLFWLGCGVPWIMPTAGLGGLLSGLDRRYGPTMPNGYYVRVEPSALTMRHTQHPQLTVTVEDAAGQPVDGVLVSFTPSEGSVTTGNSHTRGGAVTGIFEAPMGSDNPHPAFVVVTVEGIEVTVFIDIVPAVFGR